MTSTSDRRNLVIKVLPVVAIAVLLFMAIIATVGGNVLAGLNLAVLGLLGSAALANN